MFYQSINVKDKRFVNLATGDKQVLSGRNPLVMESEMSNSEVAHIEDMEQLAEKLRQEKKNNFSYFTQKSIKNLFSLVPYADKLVQFFEDYESYSNNNEINRLVQFFYGINYQDNPNVLTGLGPEYAEQIIDCVMKDSEEDKLYYYQNLVLNINSSSLAIEDRKDITSIVRSISVRDIKLALKYYMHQNFDIKGYYSRDEGLKTLVDDSNGFIIRSTNILVSQGIIKLSNNKKWDGSNAYIGTPLLKDLIELISESNKINVEAINEQEKECLDVIFGIEQDIINNGGMKAISNIVVDNIYRQLSELKDHGISFSIIKDTDYEHLKNNIKTKMFAKIRTNDDGNVILYFFQKEDDFINRDDIYNGHSIKLRIIEKKSDVDVRIDISDVLLAIVESDYY